MHTVNKCVKLVIGLVEVASFVLACYFSYYMIYCYKASLCGTLHK